MQVEINGEEKAIIRDFSHLTMDEYDVIDKRVKFKGGIICGPIALKVRGNTKEIGE